MPKGHVSVLIALFKSIKFHEPLWDSLRDWIAWGIFSWFSFSNSQAVLAGSVDLIALSA